MNGPASRPVPVTFFLVYGYGPGGLPRTVFALADELHRRGHPVEVVSVTRPFEKPQFEVEEGVKVSYLLDLYDPRRPERPFPRPRDQGRGSRRRAGLLERKLDARPSRLSAKAHSSFSRLVDLRLRKKMRSIRDGVVITTRPELGVASTRWTGTNVLRVHQEHLSFQARPKVLREDLERISSELDALLGLTEADAEAWNRTAAGRQTFIDHIPNASPFAIADPSPLENKIVIAAGRLTRQKGFDRLIEAYAPLATAHPDWQLHIYGVGNLQKKLEAQIARHGVGDQVRLMGFSNEFRDRLREASVYVLSSRFEGLPMVLLEAMSQGVPPVSFDCPEGPAQLINNGRDGFLVPDGDIEGLRHAIDRVVTDDALRRKLGQGALESARSYQMDSVADRWEELFDRLAERRRQA